MRVLFLTHRVPYAPNRGDRIRAYHMLRYLKTAGMSVCLVALAHDDEERAAAGGLADLADALHVVRVPRTRNLARAGLLLATNRPLTHVLLDSRRMRPVLERACREHRPDVVLAFCSGMARFAMEPPLDAIPFVLDMVDVDSFKWEELAAKSRGPRRWVYRREARLLRRFESEAARAARATLVVNTREGTALRGIESGSEPVVLPNGIDIDAFRNTHQVLSGPEVVFSGVFSYQPNESGALWLIEHVWPLLRELQPEAHLTLVGSGPSPTLRRRAASAGVEVTGTVPDVRPYLWRGTVAVAPLHTARGVQNKVLEAVAAGLPAVVTPAVYEGLPDPVRAACRIASGACEFAAAIRDLSCRSKEVQETLSRVSIETLAWEKSLAPLGGILARTSE